MAGIFNKKDNKDNAALSFGKSKTVCGYEIKKMPLGPYLRAVERLNGLPGDFLGQCFPGKDAQAIVDDVKRLDDSMLMEIAQAAFVAVPKYAVGVVSELTGINEDALMNDPNIGLIGLLDIVQAFIEVNGFKSKAISVIQRYPLRRRITGFMAFCGASCIDW